MHVCSKSRQILLQTLALCCQQLLENALNQDETGQRMTAGGSSAIACPLFLHMVGQGE